MTVKRVVMAHPTRKVHADLLADQLEAEVVYDQRNHIWDTARRALLAHDDADHVAVIQDDAIVCPDLPAAIDEVVTAHPGRCVSLYLGTQRPHQVQVRRWMLAADDMGATMIDGRGPFWGVGLVIPTPLVADMVAWGDRYQNAGQSYDSRLTAWSNVNDVSWLYPWPSLVDHDTRIASLHSSTPDRRAHRYIGDRSPLGTDWTRVQQTDAASLHPPVVFVHETTGRKRRVGKWSRDYERLTRNGPWRVVE